MKISEISDFLENAYKVLNEKLFNNELSRAIITIQSSPKKFGHYTIYNAWQDSDNFFPEINLSAEYLARPIENVIATLLHEMVHHYCLQKGIKDCSRGGVYHNKNFKEQAEARSLIIEYDPTIGFSKTSPSKDLIAFIKEKGWEGVVLSRTVRNLSSSNKLSSTRKYICPKCGMSVRATKNVNIGCLDCHTVMILSEKRR